MGPDGISLLAAVGVWQQLTRGGLIAAAILLLSVVLLTLTIVHFMHMRHAAQCPEELLEEAEECVRSGRHRRAEELLAADPSALAAVLDAALRYRSASTDRLSTVVDDAAAEQAAHMAQRVAYIGLIAAIAPMLGLLGTVSGMIRAFAAMSATNAAPDASTLAGAISEALITTYLGLIVAIPALVVHLVLKHRAANLSLHLVEMGEQFIRTLQGAVPGAAPPGGRGRTKGRAP